MKNNNCKYYITIFVITSLMGAKSTKDSFVGVKDIQGINYGDFRSHFIKLVI